MMRIWRFVRSKVKMDNSTQPITIEHVIDGAQAIDFLFCTGEYATRNRQNRPKVILLDLKLPKVDGLKCSNVLRRKVIHGLSLW